MTGATATEPNSVRLASIRLPNNSDWSDDVRYRAELLKTAWDIDYFTHKTLVERKPERPPSCFDLASMDIDLTEAEQKQVRRMAETGSAKLRAPVSDHGVIVED